MLARCYFTRYDRRFFLGYHDVIYVYEGVGRQMRHNLFCSPIDSECICANRTGKFRVRTCHILPRSSQNHLASESSTRELHIRVRARCRGGGFERERQRALLLIGTWVYHARSLNPRSYVVAMRRLERGYLELNYYVGQGDGYLIMYTLST